MLTEKLESGYIIQLSSGEKWVVEKTDRDYRGMYTIWLKKGKLEKKYSHVPAKADIKVVEKGGK